MSYFIAAAITSLRPGAQWSLNGDDPANINWLDATIDAPTIEEIVSEATRLQRAHEAAMPLTQAKVARVAEVEAIVVTTASGNTFDGDEDSQGRMARAVVAMGEVDTTLWVLADNTPVVVTREELREALRLTGEAQTAIWVRPYQ